MARGKLRTVAAVPLEKVEQQNIVQLARALGADVYTIGTTRSRGKACPKCGTFVAEHQGTRQTEGKADLEIWLPDSSTVARASGCSRMLLLWETKRKKHSTISDEQHKYAALARAAGIAHGFGDLDAFIAWCIARGYCKAEQFPHYRTQTT